MNNKTVLIIEDSEAQRLSLQLALEMRGFRVESAGDVATARSLITKLRGELDVMVLDMRLEDPDYPDITGADLGIEAMRMYGAWHPEFLINSAYSEVSYYELALDLRVAAYLHKSISKPNQIIQHIRALALRHALSVKRPDLARKIEQIAESSRDQSEAVKKICREILVPEFKSGLGAPFILLLTDKDSTFAYGGDTRLPQGEDPAYDVIQAMAYAECAGMEPFVFDLAKSRLPHNAQGNTIINALNDAVFISLSFSRNFLLTLGILKAESGDFPLAEKPAEMAEVLISHIKPAVLEQLLKLSSYWAENNAKRSVRLSETSNICLYIGQEQLSIIQDALDSGEWSSDSLYYQKLQNLAVDLHDTGQVLSSVRGIDLEGIENTAPLQAKNNIQMADFVTSVWKEINSSIQSDSLKVTGNCAIEATVEDMFIIVSRILQWFTQRFVEYSAGTRPEISVHCRTSDEGPVVIIEDRSRRLNEQLRKRLFDPFTQAVPLPSIGSGANRPGLYLPLYLAKVLVEEKYHGEIVECSNEIVGDLGHRFAIRFQPPQSAAK